MPPTNLPAHFTRDYLFSRHQLSHQQIDDLFGEKESQRFPAHKAQMLSKLHFFQHTVGLFDRAGIPFIPLKGFLLSQRIYQDPTYRITGDFDFLIAPERINAVIQLFHDNGFRPAQFHWPKSIFRQKVVMRGLHLFPMINHDNSIYVELHWRLFPDHIMAENQLRKLIQNHLTEIQMEGRFYTQFTHELELVFLIIHGGLHAWHRMKWLMDVHELLERFPLDEVKFCALAKKLKAARLVAVCNAMLQELFPGSKVLPCDETPHPFLLRHSRETFYGDRVALDKSLSEIGKRARFKLTAIPSLRYKLSAFRFAAYTQKEVNDNWFPPFRLFVIVDKLWGRVLNKLR